MNRSWFRRYFWWTSNFPMHQKESRKKNRVQLRACRFLTESLTRGAVGLCFLTGVFMSWTLFFGGSRGVGLCS